MPCRCATSCATAPNTGPGKNYSLRKQSDQLNAQTGGMRIRTETLRARTGDRDHRSAYNGPGNKKSAGTLRFRRISGGAEGTRTPDPLHAMQVRYQLRHSPEIFVAPAQIQPVNPARSADFLSGSLRSNSNILDQPFGKFQIGHIRLFRAVTPYRTRRQLWPTCHFRVAGPPRGSPSRGAPRRRKPGLPRAGRG